MKTTARQLKNPDIRCLKEMKEVLYDQKWAETVPNLEFYYMQRGRRYANGLRYDITVIPFQLLGKELVKTKGHQHPEKYAELYEVLAGKAIFLLQKYKKNKIEDVYAVKAEKGNKVFIPPHYGHVTINPGPSELKTGNWVADGFKSDYSLFLEKQGACYYAILDKGELKWVQNENYGRVPELRFEKPNKNIPKDLRKALLGK